MTRPEVTDREPTPAPHTAGSDQGGTPRWGSTRTRAHVRARLAQLPPVPELLRVLFVGDSPLPFGETWPRLHKRIDYALTGTWTAPPPLKDNGKRALTPIRLAYLLLFTLPIACPIAIALDFLDWATHPAGRLAVTCLVLWLLHII